MASLKKIPCKFFAQGICRYGESCSFFHEQSTSIYTRPSPSADIDINIEKLSINHTDVNHLKKGTICRFFLQGSCNRGDECWYSHPPVDARPAPITHCPSHGQHEEAIHQESPDSQFSIACRFLLRPGGCQKPTCPYSHAIENHRPDTGNTQVVEPNENEVQELDDDFTRVLSGASVCFNEFGYVLKVSLPTDFSLACITGLGPGTTPETIVAILRNLGFELTADCVRIPSQIVSSEIKATVKVEDPLFAKDLSMLLKNHKSRLSATPIPVDTRQANCRKVHISWHKASRNVWVNFRNGQVATIVAEKFNEGTYKCLGQVVKSSAAKSSQTFQGRFSHNPLVWRITLGSVSRDVVSKDIEDSIKSILDRPCSVELGKFNYEASDDAVSVEVRAHLEKYGPLENFYLSPATSTGKRIKVTATFQEEADARSACSLNNKAIEILGNGKLTVTLVQSAKIKVSSTIYSASESRIDEERVALKKLNVFLRVYHDPLHPFTVLKIEGSSPKDIAEAQKRLDEVFKGVTLQTDDGTTIWVSAFGVNGSTSQKLKSIEKQLDVVIFRDRSKRQLQFYGPPKKLDETAHMVSELVKKESSTAYEIALDPSQLTWALQGGFNMVEKDLGRNIANLNVVSMKIIINGTEQQYEKALMIMSNSSTSSHGTHSVLDKQYGAEKDCPICLCEADTPVTASCGHTYCLECFEECCKSAVTISQNDLQINCQGGGGTCSAIFTLSEIREYLSSAVFETILKSSFETFIQRNPNSYHYCPTPDCSYIYRRTTDHDSNPPPYRCPNCQEDFCTSCHALHEEYTCAEYRDIASGGYKALQKVKEELNIKDCPNCTTLIEKIEGCDHMTCEACAAHICWVCMAVFQHEGPCYEHMNREHGGIGLDVPIE